MQQAEWARQTHGKFRFYDFEGNDGVTGQDSALSLVSLNKRDISNFTIFDELKESPYFDFDIINNLLFAPS